jgi:hypothetical protein
MTEIVTPQPVQAIVPPTDETANQLREVIGEMTTNIISGLKRAAELVKKLDAVGFDYAGFPSHLISLARAVANNRLLPDTVKLQGSVLFRYAEKVPLSTQAMILRDESVSVLDLAVPSPEITRRIPISALSKRELAIVFSENGIRNPEQQFAQLRLLQASKLPDAIPALDDWTVDRKKGEVVINGKRYSRKQLLRMIEAIGD